MDYSLLDSSADLIACPNSLNACLNSHGLYNSFQFVLRLSPEVHRKLAALPTGIVTGEVDFDGLQAFSTYLHETIHWWQHVGSTTGLLLSLSYPGQAHANYNHLKTLLSSIGPKKSILRFVEISAVPGGGPETPTGRANVVVNNHFDIEFFRILATSPLLAQQVAEHPLFHSLGHSYVTAYANILLTLASTIRSLDVTPDPRDWEEGFAALRSNKAKGHYRGSALAVVPIGAHQIFEGQARFAQLQYLYFASGARLGWDEVRSKGMLKGVYGAAFETFLRLAELEWPPSIDHAIVALFLLICDMAINPGAGFPMPLRFLKTFIEDVDPGFRFLFLCRTIARQRPDLAHTITQYSRAEYAEVSGVLADLLQIDPPLAIAETVTQWVRDSEVVKSLMAEHERFAYGDINLPVRLLFSHFLAFSEDKLSRPEVLCWPGAWMTGKRVSSEIVGLFERCSAPFLDKAEDGGIYPRLMVDKDESIVQRSFDGFYAMNVTYDLTRQWIAKAGPFEYDYDWLSSSGTQADRKTFGDRHFERIYGVHPDSFELI